MLIKLQAVSKRHPTWNRLAQRLQREQELHAGLDHPHIVQLLGAVEDDDNTYLVLECCCEFRLSQLPRNLRYHWRGCLAVGYRSADACYVSHELPYTRPCTLRLALRPPCLHRTACNAAGSTMADVVWQLGPLSEPQAARVMEQVLSAVCHLHSKGICHRDIKLSK